VSLRWLKDQCNLITRSDGSFSGDELAMALCRVLLSNKAGDEVFNVLLNTASNLIFVAAIIWFSHHLADSWWAVGPGWRHCIWNSSGSSFGKGPCYLHFRYSSFMLCGDGNQMTKRKNLKIIFTVQFMLRLLILHLYNLFLAYKQGLQRLDSW